MAEIFHVHGPTTIQVCLLGDDASYVTLGHTDNTDLVEFEETDHWIDHTSNETGDMCAEAVSNGSEGMLSMTLMKWDEANIKALRSKARIGLTDGTLEGSYAQVGKMLIADSRFFGLKILTTRSGENSYTFKKVWMPSPVRHRDFGNIGKKMVLVFRTLPDTATGKFYVPAANA